MEFTKINNALVLSSCTTHWITTTFEEKKIDYHERVQFFFQELWRIRRTSEERASEFLSHNKWQKTNLHHSSSLPSPGGK